MRSAFQHPHTILLHWSPLAVRNLHETLVSESQLQARALLKSFAVAASAARAQYGNDVAVLPQPISVQCVQTDGRRFQFGSYQLNTLRLDDDAGGADAVKNVWYSVPPVSLFDVCEYRVGQPVLTEYNRQVMKYMLAFYRNN